MNTLAGYQINGRGSRYRLAVFRKINPENWREHCRERVAELRAARADLTRARAAYESGGLK